MILRVWKTTLSTRGLALACIATLVLLVSGCGDGYPDHSPRQVITSDVMLGNFHDAISAGRTEVKKLRLAAQCSLRIRWADGTRGEYDLRRLRTQAPDRDDGERFALLLIEDLPTRRERLLVGTSHWSDWLKAKGSLIHLSRLCAQSRK
jgi:hypothetical protein